MRNDELANKVIDFLAEKAIANVSRPRRFSPKEIADEVKGVHTAIGHVVNQIVAELLGRGIQIQYVRNGKQRYFELF